MVFIKKIIQVQGLLAIIMPCTAAFLMATVQFLNQVRESFGGLIKTLITRLYFSQTALCSYNTFGLTLSLRFLYYTRSELSGLQYISLYWRVIINNIQA